MPPHASPPDKTVQEQESANNEDKVGACAPRIFQSLNRATGFTVTGAECRMFSGMSNAFLQLDTIFGIKLIMNSSNRKTLAVIFTEPTPRTLAWRKVESLLVAVGCEIIEGDGSRVGFKLGSLRADFHRPHPGKEAKPYQVRAVREFLELLEVKP